MFSSRQDIKPFQMTAFVQPILWIILIKLRVVCQLSYQQLLLDLLHGEFVNFNETSTNSNGSYRLDYYVLPYHLKTARECYCKTKDIIQVYKKFFGEYPCVKDGVAMVKAPFEGMEHQSAIAIGDVYKQKNRSKFEKTECN